MKSKIQKPIKIKSKQITTIEMEFAISILFGIRKHIIVPNLSWGFVSHECDIFLVKKSRYAVEVEIKRSYSDFMADFNKSHHHKERNNKIAEFYYAFPSTIVDRCRDLVPEGVGIIVCERQKTTETIWASIERRPIKIKNSRKLTIEEVLKVASLGCMRIWNLKSKVVNLQNQIKNG
jgi:hypothetical protein